MILKWLRERKMRWDDAQFKAGFSYAAGELLWGMNKEQIQSQMSEIDRSNFDRGMEVALQKWDEKFLPMPLQ